MVKKVVRKIKVPNKKRIVKKVEPPAPPPVEEGVCPAGGGHIFAVDRCAKCGEVQ